MAHERSHFAICACYYRTGDSIHSAILVRVCVVSLTHRDTPVDASSKVRDAILKIMMCDLHHIFKPHLQPRHTAQQTRNTTHQTRAE